MGEGEENEVTCSIFLMKTTVKERRFNPLVEKSFFIYEKHYIFKLFDFSLSFILFLIQPDKFVASHECQNNARTLDDKSALLMANCITSAAYTLKHLKCKLF